MITILTDQSVQIEYETDYSDGITISALQDFSAPVTLNSDYTTEDYIRLMSHDRNGFNRWEAGQTLARTLLGDMAKAIENGAMPNPTALFTPMLKQ